MEGEWKWLGREGKERGEKWSLEEFASLALRVIDARGYVMSLNLVSQHAISLLKWCMRKC